MANSKRTRDFHKKQTAERRARRITEWQEARDAHLLSVNYRCEIGPRLAAHGIAAYRACEGNATDGCHHALARGMGGSRDHSGILATCRHCHRYCETHPEDSEAIGAKIRHGI